MKNAAKPTNFKEFKAYFRMGSQEYFISACSYGFATFPDRYSCAAVDLDKYLIKKDLNIDTNERIQFASFAESQEEFVSYLNLFFNLEFKNLPDSNRDRI